MTARTRKALAATLGSSIVIAGAVAASPNAFAQENQPPVITANDVTVPLNGEYGFYMVGASATDPEDGNVTDSMETSGTVDTSTPGEYPITITASDANGLKTSRTVTVTVLGSSEPAPKNTAPVITAKDVTLNVGEKFEIALINPSATDAEDGNVTDSIEILENNVDTSKPGTYYVTLAAYDSWGFQAKKIVTVTVVDPAATATASSSSSSSSASASSSEAASKSSEAKKSDAKSSQEKASGSKSSQANGADAKSGDSKDNSARSLARTGASVLGIVIAGVALVVGGIFLMRRRRG